MKSMADMARAESKATRAAWDIGKDLARINATGNSRHSLKMEQIVNRIVEASGVSRRDLLGKTRLRSIARARQYAYFLCRKEKIPLAIIGGFFGRDHSTVRFGVIATAKRLGDGAE